MASPLAYRRLIERAIDGWRVGDPTCEKMLDMICGRLSDQDWRTCNFCQYCEEHTAVLRTLANIATDRDAPE